MRLIIAGSRHFKNNEWVLASVEYFTRKYCVQVTTILSGGASGVDSCAEWVANRLGIPFERYPADWRTHGRAAGPIRNALMASCADALLLIWDGKSPGSANMLEQARRHGLTISQTRIINLNTQESTQDVKRE